MSHIIGVTASNRSRIKPQAVLAFLKAARDFDDVVSYINEEAVQGNLSNSEAGLVAALYGVIKSGAELKDIVVLRNVFSEVMQMHDGRDRYLKEVMTDCAGVVFATPVYFGDRSSYLNAFLTYLNQERIVPDGCVAGFVSAGAKRNGGQETTNIYGLADCLRVGFSAVGNGPPTSQYGGTIFAGNIGAVADESFGLNTSRGTGKRVGTVSQMLTTPPAKRLKVLLIGLSCDRITLLAEKVRLRISAHSNVEMSFLNLSDYEIRRCAACSSCPNPKTKNEGYKCILPDGMKDIRRQMIAADAILLLSEGEFDADFKFQLFMERTRFIRRNHYELSNMPIAMIHLNQTPNNMTIFPLRLITSFLRHNTIIAAEPLIVTSDADGGLSVGDIKSYLDHFISISLRIANGSKIDVKDQVKYEAIGYK